MKKGLFKLSIICVSLLFIIGVFALSGETDEPGLRGDNSVVVELA